MRFATGHGNPGRSNPYEEFERDAGVDFGAGGRLLGDHQFGG